MVSNADTDESVAKEKRARSISSDSSGDEFKPTLKKPCKTGDKVKKDLSAIMNSSSESCSMRLVLDDSVDEKPDISKDGMDCISMKCETHNSDSDEPLSKSAGPKNQKKMNLKNACSESMSEKEECDSDVADEGEMDHSADEKSCSKSDVKGIKRCLSSESESELIKKEDIVSDDDEPLMSLAKVKREPKEGSVHRKKINQRQQGLKKTLVKEIHSDSDNESPSISASEENSEDSIKIKKESKVKGRKDGNGPENSSRSSLKKEVRSKSVEKPTPSKLDDAEASTSDSGPDPDLDSENESEKEKGSSKKAETNDQDSTSDSGPDPDLDSPNEPKSKIKSKKSKTHGEDSASDFGHDSDLDSENESKNKKDVSKKAKTNNQDNSSNSDSNSDNEERENKENESKKKLKGKKAGNKQKDKKDPNANPTIVRLKNYIYVAGLRVKYSKLWEGCKSNKARVGKMMSVLETAGIEGRPTLQKCKALKQKRETDREIAELSTNVILNQNGRSLRRRENTPNQLSASCNDPPPEMKKAFQRIKAVFDSDSE